jgi:hypothetical protein
MTTLTSGSLLVAEVAWPAIQLDSDQLDWIDHMFAIESWLDMNVGSNWRWRDAPGGGLAVQFQRPQDLAWFQLRWL